MRIGEIHLFCQLQDEDVALTVRLTHLHSHSASKTILTLPAKASVVTGSASIATHHVENFLLTLVGIFDNMLSITCYR